MKKYFVLFILSLIIFGFFLWQGIYKSPNPNLLVGEIFFIQKGEGIQEIAYRLEKRGFIRSAPLFRIYAFLTGVAGKFQAGEYIIFSTMNASEITEKFVSGDVIQITITIPEGFNLTEVVQRLSEDYPESSQIKELRIISFLEDFEFFKDAPPEATLEGFLFPDTYQFSFRASSEDIAKKMLANFDRKLTIEIREEIIAQNKAIFEIIVIASLIEKEVKTFKDKKLVSGILWKRLDNSIPLQIDATIVYITGKKTTRISKEETEIDSPYNTYKYLGLPLGPISNPGLESILAAIYPEDNPFWYYLSTPTGETIFSKTLEEHNIAKARYLK